MTSLENLIYTALAEAGRSVPMKTLDSMTATVVRALTDAGQVESQFGGCPCGGSVMHDCGPEVEYQRLILPWVPVEENR